MDWTTIILALLSGTTVGGVVEAIRYRRQNLKIKNSEATVSDATAQQAQMDIVVKFRDEMMTMIDLVKNANEKNFTNQDQILDKLGRMDERLEKVEIKMGDIEAYLNGPYHQWLASKEGIADSQPSDNQE